MKGQKTIKCIFCGKETTGEKDAPKMIISGIPGVAICFDCVKRCEALLANDKSKKKAHSSDYVNSLEVMKPKDIKKKLDEFVVGQEKAKIALSVAIYNHYKKIKNNVDSDINNQLDKSNILLIGDSGTGKCVTEDTVVKVRNKVTGEVMNISIMDFKNMLSLA